MSEPGFASLGPSLLARKGGAKPAMRPQIAPLVPDADGFADDQFEDLGWNDMGEHEAQGGADIVPINAGMGADDFGQNPGPVIRRQQRRLEELVLADAVMTGPDDREPEYDDEDEAFYGENLTEPAYGDVNYAGPKHVEPNYSVQGDGVAAFAQPDHIERPAALKARVPAIKAGRRAAFTLRLDADRHLKLRLAATMQGVSAQVLVTEALDRLLAEFGDFHGIANQLKRH